MKSLPILALVIAGLVGACSYRHETVERPAPAPATVVATPATQTGTGCLYRPGELDLDHNRL